MIGRVLSVSKTDSVFHGLISAQDGTELEFYNPTVYVRPGFIFEFDVIESNGCQYAQLIKQAEIEYPELTSEELNCIITKVDVEVDTKGFLTALEFSKILMDNGISDVKSYAKNMTAFIGKYLSPRYIARNDVRINGKLCPCSIVPDSANGHLEFSDIHAEIKPLDKKMISETTAILKQYINEHGFIKGPYFPTLLKKAGIDDFHKYSPSISAFISSYFSTEFKVKTNVIIDGKNQPCVITALNNGLDEDTINNAIIVLRAFITEHGYIKGAQFPMLLKQAGVSNFRDFTDSISSFISLFFSNEFKVETNVYIDGKTQPCIITDINADLHNSSIEEMKGELLQTIEQSGFADFSLVMNLFEKYHISEDVLPSSFSEFVEKEFNGLEIHDNVVINHMYYERVLLTKERVSYVDIHDYSGDLIIPSEVILDISQEISSVIKSNGFMISSDLPMVFKRCGIADYKVYTESLAQFVEKYLLDFESKTNAFIGGKNYPAIIIERGQEISFFSSDDSSVLSQFFESGEYYAFLESDHFSKYRPVDIPPVYFIKAITCAKRLLTKDNSAVFMPNSFQKTLLSAPLGADIIKKYKKVGVIDKVALEECFSTSIPHRNITNKKERTKAATELFNAIGFLAHGSHNTDYIGLIERAESCTNELYPYLLLIRIIISSGRKYELLNELCRKVKAVSRAKGVSDLTLSVPENWLYLPSIISVCEEHDNLVDPSRIFLTQLFSTFVDLNALDEISPIGHLFTERMFEFFFEMYSHYEGLSESDYRELLTENLNKELYQKIAAQIWERIGFVDSLPPALLKLLAYTLKYDGRESVDEILRLRIKGGELTKKEKRLSLLSSFSDIISILNIDDSFYGLGVYAKDCYTDLAESALTTDMKMKWEQWETIASNYYSQKTYSLFPVTTVTANTIIELFDVFKLDFNHEIYLQQGYADWIMSLYQFDKASDDVEIDLDKLYNSHAYEAFRRIYNHTCLDIPEQANKQLSAKYIKSLIELHYYDEALAFVIDNNDEKYILQVIIEICDRCGISEKTRTIFTKVWSLEEALAFVSKQYTANATYVINTMIVLYCVMNNPFYAIYLYACYEDSIVRGHSHIYTQFLKWLGNRFTKVVNNTMTKYSVIEKSFNYLPTEQLIDFMAWCGGLKLPAKTGLTKKEKQMHSFAANYDFLTKHAKEPQKWRAFLEHIIKRPNLNAWKICVCVNIISFLEGKTAIEYANVVVQMAESQLSLDAEEIPFNFLNMTCQFIEFTDADSLNKKILNAIVQSSDFKNRICVNPITSEDNYAIKDYIRVCANKFNEKNDDVYFKLIEQLDSQENLFTLIDISRLFDHDEGRITILRHLCKIYDKVEDIVEFKDMLYNEHWNVLGYIESNLLSIVRFLYDGSNELTQAFVPETLNQTEHNTIRIKKDVAKILSCYPSKQNLFYFDKETYSVSYKMLVYSIVASVLYDQELYSPYFDCGYGELRDLAAFDVFSYFSYKLYLFQVYHNCDFDLFYIERRYQKAFLARCLMSANLYDNIDESEIVSIMEFFGHKELSYQTRYQPFRNAMMSLMTDTAINNIEHGKTIRDLFILSLLNGKFDEFFYECINHDILVAELFNLKEMKYMVSEVAYREYSVSAFKYYLNHSECIDFLMNLSKGTSQSVHDVFAFLKTHTDSKSHELFVDIIQSDKASGCVSKILKVPSKDFDKYHELLIPLLASVQLPLRLYEKMYSLVAKGDTSDRYISVLSYISADYPQSKTIYRFLRCAQAAICKDTDTLEALYSDLEFQKNLPEAWKRSYLTLKNYKLSDMSEAFVLPNFEGDSSFRTVKSSELKFVETVSKLLNIHHPTASDIEELYATYQVSNTEKKTELGIQLLMATPKMFNKRSLPSYHELAFIIGMEMLRNEQKLTHELRIMILADLYNVINMLSITNQREFYELGKRVIDKLIQEGIDLYCWCKYYDLISKFISKDEETNRELALANTQIMPVLRNALQSSCSLEQRLEDLKSLHIAAMYYSRFAGYLQKAVEHEIKHLEKGIKLHIEIVNDICSDGCIYAQIINIGQSTVNLDNNGENHIKITWNINDNPNEILIPTDKSDTITELRHGYVSGFCVKLPIEDSSVSSVDVTVSAYLNHTLYSRCRKTIQIDYTLQTVTIDQKRQWYHVDSAVTDEDMLFGRENDKEQLSQSLSEGLTVLYGPSRIGKTSLLNWVRRSLSTQKVNASNSSAKSIITVLLAGERTAKERDYFVKFFDKTHLDYSNPKEISEYLLCESIINSFGNSRRLAVVGEEITDNLKNQIITALSDISLNLEDRYSNLEDLLSKNRTELWLLMDEFQEVVRQWKEIDPTTSSFALVCSDLKISDTEYPHSIRLVLCGSDELLKQMTTTEGSVWRRIIPDTGILVGPLPKDGFKKMICEAEEFPKDLIHYSESAIDALYTYTGGIALYGKEICNTLLRKICNDSSFFTRRDTIFPSDISWAVQTLLNRQEHEQKTNGSVAGGIIHIYDAVVKNLDEETDKRFLTYIAQWLRENPSNESFPKSVFTSMLLKDVYAEKLGDSIEVAVKRGILRELRDVNGIVCAYTFTTVFYYYAFLGINKMSCDQIEELLLKEPDVVDLNENTFVENSTHAEIDTFRSLFGNMPPQDQAFHLGGLLTMSKPEAKEGLKDIIAEQYHINDSQFTKEGHIQVVQVNIQSITNTLNGILTANGDPQKILTGLQDLPRLSAYLPAIDADGQSISDTRLSYAIDGYTNDMEESLQTAVDVTGTELPMVWDILKISEEDYNVFHQKYNIPACFIDSLRLAAQLEEMFMNGSVGGNLSTIDYSPVSIMYCKLIESMLKEYHTEAYSQALAGIETDLRKNAHQKYTWGAIRNLPQQQKQKLTIGSFAFPINVSRYNTQSDTTSNISDLANGSYGNASDWRTHAAFIANIRDIRNPSAHGNMGHQITLAQLQQLTKELFDDKGFLRLIELVKKPIA
jgi:hypothetical protein